MPLDEDEGSLKWSGVDKKKEVIMADSNVSVLPGAAIPAELTRSENELVIEVGQALAHKAGIKNPLVLRAYQGVVTCAGRLTQRRPWPWPNR